MNENSEMSDFLKNHTLIKSDPLDPYDAFFDSCIGNISLRNYNTKKIHYMYAALCIRMCQKWAFLYDHPDIYVGEEYNELI